MGQLKPDRNGRRFVTEWTLFLFSTLSGCRTSTNEVLQLQHGIMIHHLRWVAQSRCQSCNDTEALQNVEKVLFSFKTLFCFVFLRPQLKLGCVTHVLSLIWRSQTMYLFFTNCLLSAPATWMSFPSNKPKKEINLQPVIQIRPAVNSSLCREVLWSSILEKLTVVQEICVNFTN